MSQTDFILAALSNYLNKINLFIYCYDKKARSRGLMFHLTLFRNNLSKFNAST